MMSLKLQLSHFSFAALLLPLALLAQETELTAEQETENYITERRAEFDQCVDHLQARSASIGIPEQIVEDVVGNLSFLPRVIELDRSQPEFSSTFEQYLSARVTALRVETGRRLYLQHRDFLAQLTEEYGVPGQYLIAFWGLETNFGSYLGDMSTLDALATLGCDPRRSEYFTDELFEALRLISDESIDPNDMRGSWAGAVGHTQFMPSNYQRYAIDGDGDGKVDLWNSEKDALTSAANFLQNLGWQPAERWGREVLIPAGFDFSTAGRDKSKSVSDWRALGVTRTDAVPLPDIDLEASLIMPSGHTGPAFMSYPNFSVIMRWNRSESYAISVGHLADRIAGGGGLVIQPPKDSPRLSRTLVTEVQLALESLGFDTNGVDGLFGSGTRAALREYQSSAGLVSDGFLDQQTLERLLKDGSLQK